MHSFWLFAHLATGKRDIAIIPRLRLLITASTGYAWDLINSLEIQMKREERIMRFLTVSMDKHAIAYSEIRKAKIKYK